MDQVCADPHIQLMHSAPQGMPRGRGKIERFVGSVNELFLPGLPGHLARGAPASPSKLTLAELDAPSCCPGWP
jgi:putative transposase